MRHFREAREDDLPVLVAMLADDFLGATRDHTEESVADCYIRAFRAIEQSDLNLLLLCVDDEDVPIGMAQCTYTPGLSYGGSWRCTIEAVRVRSDRRAQGHGSALIQEAIRRARDGGCRLVQLSTHRERADAVRFYQRLGFKDTHHGFKLDLQHE